MQIGLYLYNCVLYGQILFGVTVVMVVFMNHQRSNIGGMIGFSAKQIFVLFSGTNIENLS